MHKKRKFFKADYHDMFVNQHYFGSLIYRSKWKFLTWRMIKIVKHMEHNKRKGFMQSAKLKNRHHELKIRMVKLREEYNSMD